MSGTIRLKLANRPATPSRKLIANIHRTTHAPRPVAKMPTAARTFSDAPSELMILCVLEDKARNLACSVIRNHIKASEEYRTNPRIKMYADLVLDIAARHESKVLKSLTMDEQIQFADLAEQYDELLDSVVDEMQTAVNEQFLSCPKAKRALWSRAVIASYISFVCVVYQNVMRHRAKVIYKLNGRLVDSVELLGIAEKFDRIVTEIWGGDVVLNNNKAYDALDAEFLNKLTDADFFYNAAVAAGFTHYEKANTNEINNKND